MAISYNPSIVTSGLVLAIDVANPKSYPGSGSTVFDLSGNGNHMSLTNSPTYTSNSYFAFNGTTQYASVADAASLNFGTGDFTALIWVSGISGYPGTNKSPIYKGARFDGNLAGWSMTWAFSPQDLYFIFSDGSTGRLEGRTIPNSGLNGWTGTKLLGMQRNGTTCYQVNNGVRTSVGSYSATITSTSPIYFGYNAYYSSYLAYNLHGVQIYNKALSDTELLQNFAAYRGRFGI